MNFPDDIWTSRRTPYGPFGIRNHLALDLERQIGLITPQAVRFRYQFTHEWIRQLGLSGELRGHEGCVNCLEWNTSGTLLASGSDDCRVRIWNPFLPASIQCVHTIATGHLGNIFGVKFLPHASDNVILSCAADATVRVHDVNFTETLNTFGCHANRVKRLAVASDSPSVFWSAGEDGLVLQYDLRDKQRCDRYSCRCVLINLNAYTPSAEVKSIACNPVRMEYLALGATDCFTRVFDRRMLSVQTIKYPMAQDHDPVFSRRHTFLMNQTYDMEQFRLPPGCVKYFAPGHLPENERRGKQHWRNYTITDVRFSADGADILANIGGEQIYLYNMNSHDPVGKVFRMEPDEKIQAKNGTVLNPLAEEMKTAANDYYMKKEYNKAVSIYNQALLNCNYSSVLYANRSIALLYRNWDGGKERKIRWVRECRNFFSDAYQALLDSYKAYILDPKSDKAMFRLIKSMHAVGRYRDAAAWLEYFKNIYSDDQRNTLTSPSFLKLEKEVESAMAKLSKNGVIKSLKNPPFFMDEESELRKEAIDFERRFVGHCNTTTDIKEANFLGQNAEFIMAGSDDGRFFIWDRESTNVLKLIRADTNIVNCLQPHPSTCIIATSGIDNEIRLWSPLRNDSKESSNQESEDSSQSGNNDEEAFNAVGMEVVDVNRATSANQRRMNADPWAVLLTPFIHPNDGPPGGGPHLGDCVQQ